MAIFKERLGLFLGLLFFFAIFSISFSITKNKEFSLTIATAFLMFSWWISEALPIPITSLLPICLFPIFGVMDLNEVTTYYSNKIIFLMLSGFLLGIALQKWKLNYRIALNILKFTGNHPSGIILGFMLATAFLSMWISNTSATLIMLPIALSFLKMLDQKDDQKLKVVLMLCIAYSANIGGISTIIGTPTNAIFVSFLDEIYDIEFSFISWFLTFFPLVLILLVALWLYLKFFQLKDFSFDKKLEESFVAKNLKKIGKISFEEKAVLIIFTLLALSWIFKGYFPFKISDSAIGLIFCSLFFLISAKKTQGRLLDWEDTKDLSWGTLILFGGGLALAKALEKNGVINLVSDLFVILEIKNYLIALIFVILIAVFLTEFMSNLALINILSPILMTISLKFGDSPMLLALPATIAASCAFMLPMATPPNAIVFSSNYLHVRDMVKAGFIANILAILIILIFGLFYF